MAELKKAHIAGSGMMRANHVAEAQKHIAEIDPRAYGDLLQHLQGVVATLGGASLAAYALIARERTKAALLERATECESSPA